MTADHIKGVAAAPGLAIGQAVRWRKDRPKVEKRQVDDADQEVLRLEKIVDRAKEQLTRLRETTRERMGDDEAGIFDAHLSFLDDPAYIGEIKNRIRDKKENAEAISEEVTEEMASMLASLPDEYMQARADDIRDVGNRILLLLSGIEPFDPSLLQSGSIVIADDLAPSDTAQFPPGVAAMVTSRGSKTAHAAIMARTLGIPAVLGIGDNLDQIQEDDTLIVDGDEGNVTINPDADSQQKARAEMERQQELRRAALEKAGSDAVTADGKRIQVFANIGRPADLETALQNGAEGIGLFRTEFLYLENDHWPTEEEQADAYAKVLKAFEGKPVVIRTLDIGGDKDLPYADLPTEENPFLGHRAIRFCLSNPEIFKTQLRALLRAGVHGDLWIMFPMVENVSEIREAKSLLEEARSELEKEGHAVAQQPKVGIMIEVPAAAVTADVLAKEVDFMSIGTNDLTQYTLAADRGNERVAPLYDAAHPAVLRLVRQTCDAARQEGIITGMCGELAGDPKMTEVLVGLGLDELSMSAGTIPEVKENVRRIETAPARTLADEALTKSDPVEIRSLSGK
ncbi:phosphoenolpyruvate--protein phosphotransferase [Melghirimyces thermohalophilus]|uniref:Phosphoenolpyruvate-protein phosphotransferase n=1 Tax=Melghirimyces thermohalophilus TaxID=1236220 RepID=A0A1G6I7K7_9BACL|nr:phosphoenolpyruvate--protein phosphotransferase [Melghirimyces thermohalophilus]SDC02517.1 phosphoenolpyruvate--protein phosphotransferase [Melghirimyces thermohalophilus]